MSRLKKGGLAAAGVGLAALAVAKIGGYEGLRLSAYRDIVGVKTICYGETKNVEMGMRLTKAQCDALFEKRLDEFANQVEKCLPEAADARKMGPHTYVAFLSSAWNIGSGGFCKSSMATRWKAGDHRGACDALLLYNRAGGQVRKGLQLRRADERALCLKDL